MKKIETWNNRIIRSKEYLYIFNKIQKISNYMNNMEFAKPNISNMHRTPSIDTSLIDVDTIESDVMGNGIVDNISNSDIIPKDDAEVVKKIPSYDDICATENSRLDEILEFTRRNAPEPKIKTISVESSSTQSSEDKSPASPNASKIVYSSDEEETHYTPAETFRIIELVTRFNETELEKIRIQQEHYRFIEHCIDTYFNNFRNDRIFWFLVLILSHLAVYWHFQNATK